MKLRWNCAEPALRLLEAGLVRRLELLVVGAQGRVGDLDPLGGHRRAPVQARREVGGGRRVEDDVARQSMPGRGADRPAARSAGDDGHGRHGRDEAACSSACIGSCAASCSCRRSPSRSSSRPSRRRRRSPPRLPGRLEGLSHLRRRWSRTSRRSPPPTRPSSTCSRSATVVPGPRAVGGQGQRQRRHRRGRARGPVRRPAPLRRAHGPRDDAAHPPLARPTATGRARRITVDRRTRARSGSCSRSTPTARSSTSRRGRFHYWRKNRQPTPGSSADRDRPQPQLRLPLGRAAAGPARTPRRSRTTGRRRSPRRRRGAMRDFLASPRGRRPAADPRRDHLPRGRPARDVAIRLHEEERPART